VDPAVLAVIRELARQNQRTMEQEIRAGLFTIANARKSELLDRLARERDEQFARFGEQPDCTPAVRAEREARR
jgi:CelD/BcsL family acetyltransferase involved in cellulose biosynthesis